MPRPVLSRLLRSVMSIAELQTTCLKVQFPTDRPIYNFEFLSTSFIARCILGKLCWLWVSEIYATVWLKLHWKFCRQDYIFAALGRILPVFLLLKIQTRIECDIRFEFLLEFSVASIQEEILLNHFKILRNYSKMLMRRQQALSRITPASGGKMKLTGALTAPYGPHQWL